MSLKLLTVFSQSYHIVCLHMYFLKVPNFTVVSSIQMPRVQIQRLWKVTVCVINLLLQQL